MLLVSLWVSIVGVISYVLRVRARHHLSVQAGVVAPLRVGLSKTSSVVKI